MLIIPDNLLNAEYPSFEENFHSLIESLSKEEAAFAKLVLLEGKKIKMFAGENLGLPFAQSTRDVLSFIESTKRISELITMEEWLLNQKLQNILLLDKKLRNEESGGEGE